MGDNPDNASSLTTEEDFEQAEPYQLQTRKLPTVAAGSVAALFYVLVEFAGAMRGPWLLGLFAVAALGLLAMRLWRRTEIDIGLDGVLIRRTLRKRFIPHDDIQEVTVQPPATGRGWHELVFRLHSGDEVSLRTDDHRASAESSVAARILEDLERARAYHRGGKSRALAMVAAGGRDVRAWLSALRKTAGQGAAYRKRVVTAADLASVVDDADAPLDARVGAAVALEHATGEGRARLRIYAEGVAQPEERQRLLRVADAEDAELEAVLGDVMREEAKTR